MNSHPAVSVVMPAYNCAGFLKEAIDSVLAQTFQDWELIIFNDASTDGTSDILKTYSHPKIIIQTNPSNQGVSRCRNSAIEIARGEWIAFLDSDDVWNPEKLQRQLEHMRKVGSNFSCTNVTWIDESSQGCGLPPELPDRITYKMLLRQNVIPLSTVMIRKVLLSEDKFESRGNEDFALWLRVLKRGEYCTVLPEHLANYRFRKNSRSSRKLRSALNNWSIYREVAELPLYLAAQYMLYYTAQSLNKYRGLKLKR